MANNGFQCRICAKLNCEESENIFEEPEGKILRHIEQLTGIMLRNLKYLPQYICSECLMDLRHARVFRRRCIKSQIYFTTPEYKSAARKQCDEDNQKQNVHMKEEQYNFVGTTTTTMDNQYNNETMEAIEAEFLLDEETDIIYENDDYLSYENSNILDVKIEDVAEASTPNCEVVEFEFTKNEKAISTATSSDQIKSSGHSKFAKFKIDSDNKDTLKVPKKRSITEYVCEQCGNCYDNVNHFRTHLNRHAGIKPFQCQNCPSKFYTKSELKLHSITHTGERPFECKHCSRSYTTSGSRLVHERLHTNERPYKCTYCPKGFRRLRNLKDHLLTHTKERKFECTLCEKNFQRRTHLAAHNRSQFHQENVAKLANLSEVDYEVISIAT